MAPSQQSTLPSACRAVVINQFGPASVLEVKGDYPVPTRKPGQVLVKIVSASINPFDFKSRQGAFSWSPMCKDKVLGADFAGLVAEADPDSQFQAGQKVYSMCATVMQGTYVEWYVVDEDRLALVPDNLPVEEAAGVPLAGETAWQALQPPTNLAEPGKRVLVLGAAGGVGHLAVQFAKAYGAHVAGTASTASLPFLKELGVDQALDYRGAPLQDALAGQQFHVVLDLVGGPDARAAFALLKPDGLFAHVLVGYPGEAEMVEDFRQQLQALGQGGRVTNTVVQHSTADLAAISDLIAAGKVRLHVAETYPLEQMAAAHARLEAGGGIQGKLLVCM